MTTRKIKTALVCFIGAAAFVLLSGITPSLAQTKETPKEVVKEGAKAEKAWFMVTSPHTEEECMKALDDVAAKGAKDLAMWRWGCMSGDHTAYAFFEAANQDEAMKQVPENLRAKAKVSKVDQFTVEQIKSFHEMHH